jgi:hypothetical protein
MSTIYANALKDSRMTDVITKLDAQSGNAELQLLTGVGGTLLVSITLAKPSFTEANQQITMAGVPVSGVASAAGQAMAGQFLDSAGTTWISGLTVGTSGTDIVLNNTTIAVNQTVTITSCVITHG